MVTNQTTNYQLNQWEPTDAVQRVEFNQDNAKVDTALKSLSDQVIQKANQSAVNTLISAVNQKADASTVSALSQAVAAKAEQTALTAEISARTAVDAELAEKAGMHLLYQSATTAAQEYIIVDMSAIDWDQWATVRVLFRPVLTGDYYNVYANNASQYMFGRDVYSRFQLHLFPNFDETAPVAGLVWPVYRESGTVLYYNMTFAQFSTLYFDVDETSFQAGSVIEIWGCK